MRRWLLPLLGLLLAVAVAAPDDKKEEKKDDGFVPMFDGKTLKGWVNVNCAPETFFVKDNEIITTGKPTGYLRTEKQYENFIADFEWMHVNKTDVGNSGFFVWADPIPAIGTGYTRGIEVQVLVNLEKEGYYTSQGDLFSIWGATCKPDRPHPHGWERCVPSENRCKGGGEWNHYKVVANDGTLKLHVNGKEVSGVSQCKPRKGYLALESEGAECHFRNLKIKELPSTDPKPAEVADEAKGHTNLYTGLDLSGWKSDAGHKGHWQPNDWVLHYDSKSEAKDKNLWTEKEYGDFELIMDWKLPKKDAAECGVLLRGSGDRFVKVTASLDTVEVQCKGVAAKEKTTAIKPSEWNRSLFTVKGQHMTVAVNGKVVIDNLSLDQAPPKGAIALVHTGQPMDFANLLIRSLK